MKKSCHFCHFCHLSYQKGIFTMMKYEQKELQINQRIFDECMKLTPAPENRVDQVYITQKKRLAKMLQEGDSYKDMVWLLWKRIGLG